MSALIDNFTKRLHASEMAQLAEMRGDTVAAARFREEHRRLMDELEPARPAAAAAAAAVPVLSTTQGGTRRFDHLFGGTPRPTPKAIGPTAKAATANPQNDHYFGK